MKVFLTGATGYIGSTVAESLQTVGHQVIGLARSEQAAQSLEAVGIEVVRGDLHQPLKWIEALCQVDGVIHTAATKDEKMPNCDRIAVTEMLSALSGTVRHLSTPVEPGFWAILTQMLTNNRRLILFL